MKQSSKRLVSILGSLVLVVGALIAFFDLIGPEYGAIAQVKGKIAGENQILTTETQLVANVQSVLAQYQQDAANSNMVDMALPNSENVAGALAQIYGLAQNNGMAIQGISISAPTIQLAATPAGGDGTASPNATNPIGSFSFQVTAIGTYQSFTNFLSGLETNVRLFDAKTVSIAPLTGGNVMNYTLQVDTYFQSNQSSSTN
jgi:Tfp pilus assembly protein PilO